MIRDLIERARRDQTLRPGECLEIHLGPDGECNPQRIWPNLADFVREWQHVMEWGEIVGNPSTPYVAIVHEDENLAPHRST